MGHHTFDDVTTVTQWRSDTSPVRCPDCGQTFECEDIGKAISHAIGHGYRLLHIGTESQRASEGLWHSTVAFIGK